MPSTQRSPRGFAGQPRAWRPYDGRGIAGASVVLHAGHALVPALTLLPLAATHHGHVAAARAHSGLVLGLRRLIRHRVFRPHGHAAAHAPLNRRRRLRLLSLPAHLRRGRGSHAEKGERTKRDESSHV